MTLDDYLADIRTVAVALDSLPSEQALPLAAVIVKDFHRVRLDEEAMLCDCAFEGDEDC